MKLGFKTLPQHTDWPRLLDLWAAVDDDERYASAWVFDHFYPIYGDTSGPCLESWVTLTALAQATERVRVGSMVNGAPYRHPAVFANMAASLDIVSGGRLDLGIGAGWNHEEADAYGIELGPLTQRFDRLEEYLACVAGLLTDEITDFDGDHYRLVAARNEPKGIQRPRPPIVIGGAGPRRTLPIVARWADHWNHPGGSADDLTAPIERLRECCAEIGRDPAEIEISTHLIVGGTLDPTTLAAQAEAYAAVGVDHLIVYPMDSGHGPGVVGEAADALVHLLD